MSGFFNDFFHDTAARRPSYQPPDNARALRGKGKRPRSGWKNWGVLSVWWGEKTPPNQVSRQQARRALVQKQIAKASTMFDVPRSAARKIGKAWAKRIWKERR